MEKIIGLTIVIAIFMFAAVATTPTITIPKMKTLNLTLNMGNVATTCGDPIDGGPPGIAPPLIKSYKSLDRDKI